MEKIAELRQKIDEIDEKILLLLKERIEISKEIGDIKWKQRIPIKDPKREKAKYRQIAKRALELGLNPEEIKNIYQKIIDMSTYIQEHRSTPSQHENFKCYTKGKRFGKSQKVPDDEIEP